MASIEDPDPFYRALCSSGTLQSESKGFFRDFSETVIETAGEAWISKIFGKLKSDEERIQAVFTDLKIKDIVLDTLRHVKELYRDKDSSISRSKRMEGLHAMVTGNKEKALLLLSQAVLRAPSKGKDTSVDQGSSLALAFLARADVLMALKDYKLALEDLQLAAKEGFPDSLRSQVYWKMGICQKELGEAEKAGVCLQLASKVLRPEQETERRELLNDIDSLKNPMEPMQDTTRKPIIPELTNGCNPSLPAASSLVEIQESPKFGRYAVAAKEILTGDTLVTEQPYAACLIPEYYGSHCQQCFTRLRAPVGCPNCSSVAFCGTECRDVAMESYHKYECKILALLIGSGMSVLSIVAFRMVTQDGLEKSLKIYEKLHEVNQSEIGESADVTEKLSKSAKRRQRKKKLKESGEKSAEVPTSTEIEIFRENNNDERKSEKTAKSEQMDEVNTRAYDCVKLADKRTAVDFLHRTLMAAFLVKCLQRVGFFRNPSKLNEPPSREEVIVGSLLLTNLQLLQFNAHEIYETRLGEKHRFKGSKSLYVGVGMYPTVALFNHDCYPAVTRYFAGRTIVIRAVRPLKPGDMVAENYGPIFTKRSLADRQRALASRYWFRCTCTACKDDWPVFKNLTNDNARLRCPTEGCPRIFALPREPGKSIKCPGCQMRVNLDDHLAKMKECESEYEQAQATMEAERSGEAIKEFCRALDKFHKVAAPPHRDTHLAQIGLGACLADSGNTWKPSF